jgi:purine-binding chemotaxis protein CheW
MSADAEWAEVRRRLSLVAPGAALETHGEADRQREVLEERARGLARPAVRAAPEEEMTLVGFGLGGESWSVEAPFVWEAFRLLQLVPLPGARAPVTGVTSWRGSVLLVLDLRFVLGVPVTPLTDLAHVLVLGDEEPAFGVLVDALGEVTRLDREALVEPGEGVALHREWILGVTPNAGFALDAARIVRAYA